MNEYGRDAPDLIDHLLGYGLIERVGKDFDIRFEAIKTALQRLVDSNSSDNHWSEISRRRNAIETDIRHSLYQWSKGISASDWCAMLERALTNARKEKLSSIEPAHLLSSTNSPLYLTDLLMMLKDVAVLSYLGDRRRLIVEYLDTVNKLRKDAHANAVTDLELRRVREAFDHLEQEFALP